MDEEKLEVGQLLSRTRQMLEMSGSAVVLYVAIVGGLTVAIDFVDNDGGSTNFGVSILNLAGGFLLVRAMLRDAGLIDTSGDAGFGAYFGLSLLSGLAIILGIIVLFVPGVILLVRWLPAFAILIAEADATVTGSMSKAWHMTGPHFWPLRPADWSARCCTRSRSRCSSASRRAGVSLPRLRRWWAIC